MLRIHVVYMEFRGGIFSNKYSKGPLGNHHLHKNVLYYAHVLQTIKDVQNMRQ